MSSLFELRGDLTKGQRTYLGIGGMAFLLLVWHLITSGANPIISKSIVPNPWDVLMSYGEMFAENDLTLNTFKSLGVNLAGYVEALMIALPIGFLVGLIPFFRGAFQKPIAALRYVPLTAVTGLFIAWFGIELDMKVHFLAFGILIYLLPIIVQRIDEVNSVYLKTVYTIGANKWQTIRSVYIPSVLSRLSDDIRVLTAISWTYIIVAETINNQGGLGSVIWFAGQRFRRYDKVFAILILIMLIGVLQDRLFVYLDKKLFPHKYQIKDQDKKGQVGGQNIFDTVTGFAGKSFIGILLGSYVILAINEFFPFLGNIKILSYLFGETVWAIHVIFITALWYSVKSIMKK